MLMLESLINSIKRAIATDSCSGVVDPQGQSYISSECIMPSTSLLKLTSVDTITSTEVA